MLMSLNSPLPVKMFPNASCSCASYDRKSAFEHHVLSQWNLFAF